MDQEEENKYVSQLQDVFNSCDTTGTGYLDKEELTELCHKLHLDAQLPLLLQTLLGNDLFARVNFEEFKEGFVAVLSTTIDLSMSEDESSYLEPVIPDEVKPKFVKGTKRYGRRTQPEFEAAENEANKYMQEAHHVKCKRKGQIRRSSSLESVESLKSDEEAESAREPHNENFEARGQLRVWDSAFFASPGRNGSLFYDMTEHQVRGIWEELGVGHNGYLNQEELATVCQNIGLKDLSKEKIEDLFKKLDQDGDGKVSFLEFQLGLFRYAPIPLSSTPLHQRQPWTFCQSLDDSSRRTATSSLLSSCGAIHLFSSIDDGTGFGNPEQIMVIWEEGGIEDWKNLLMSLDFSLEDRINLLDLTTALDSELIATKNRFHLAALASYKHELQYQSGQVNQITRERDKFKRDLERAEKRNLQLADEVDDHNSVMEQLNENKIKELEQEHRQRLSMIRTELEREKEQFLQNTDQQRSKLESDLSNYQMEESFLRDKLNLSIKENNRLQKEVVEIVGKLTESEKQVEKLQATVDHILKEKGVIDPHNNELCIQEEHFAEIIKQYEAQCRELRDHNDELQIQMETLRSQLSESKYSRLLAKMKDNKLLHHKTKEKIHLTNGVPGKKGLSTRLRRSSSAAGVNGTATVESEHSPMNMEVELTKHQLKEQQQEIQDLKIQLETKVNYYEREVELIKSNVEEERKETEQSFKIEISELEEQKADLEELNTKYQEVIDSLKEQLHKSAHVQDLEKRFEKERAEMEQYYAKEISTLGKKLTSEKEQLEEEIKRFHQQELQSMREEAEEELNRKLSDVEAQYAEYCQTIVQQLHQNEEEVLLKHEADKKALIEEHILERTRWGEEEKAIMVQWKKEMLKLEEKQNEEQALNCKTFAVEKERIENQYRTQIDWLNEEIRLLNARFIEQQSFSSIKEQHMDKGKVSLMEKRADDGSANQNKKPFSLSEPIEKDGNCACAIDNDELIKPNMVSTDNLVSNENDHIQMEIKQTAAQHLQCQQVSSSFRASEEWLALLKQAEENAVVQLQEMESVISSLRAQLQHETKDKEVVLKNQRDLEEEKSHFLNWLKSMVEDFLLAKTEGKKLPSQNRESSNSIRDEAPRSQGLVREWDEPQKHEVDLQSFVSELEHNISLMRDKERDLTVQLEQAEKESTVLQNLCQSLENVEERHLVEELINRNVLLSQQLKNKKQEVLILQSKLRENDSKFEQMEEEATKRVQDAIMSDLVKEKDSAIAKLFELEDLVREIEVRASMDNRMELCRHSEDNGELKDKLERLQKEAGDLEDINKMSRMHLEDLTREKNKLQSDLQELTTQNEMYQDELRHLNTQTLQLNGTVSDLSAQNLTQQDTIQLLNSRLQEVTQHMEEEADATLKRHEETLSALEKEELEQLSTWQNQMERLEQELQVSKVENEKYREELHHLDSQSLHLNGTLSNLSSHSITQQETIRQLHSRLHEVTVQMEEADTAIKQLQETVDALEKEKLEHLSAWQNQRESLEQELQMYRQKNEKYQDELRQLNSLTLQLNSTVSNLSAQNMTQQETIQQLHSRLQEVTQHVDEADGAVKQFQEKLSTMEKENLEEISAWHNEQEKFEQELQISKEKLLDLAFLEKNVSELKKEKQKLVEEHQIMSEQLKEATNKLMQMSVMESNLKHVQEECQALRITEAQLKETLDESQDQLEEANAKLMLAKSQHVREIQQLKEQISASAPMDELNHLQNRLLEEQQKVHQMREKLRFHAEQATKQLAMQQEAHEKLLRKMENRMESIEMNLKNVRIMLQEKIKQLKEQLEKNTKSDLLLKDLYVENAHLMKALQVTEERQKSAERRNYLFEEKIAALNKVLRKIAPASLAV